MKRIKTMRKAKVLIWTVFSLLLLMPAAYAQQAEKKINGSVKDNNGNPLAGVTVEVKNTKLATTTNASGLFSILAPANAGTLVFSSVGMLRKEVAINTSGIVAVVMEPVSQNLNEVVVIGYGTAKRTNV